MQKYELREDLSFTSTVVQKAGANLPTPNLPVPNLPGAIVMMTYAAGCRCPLCWFCRLALAVMRAQWHPASRPPPR